VLQVINFTFLGDFHLLPLRRNGSQTPNWAQPAIRDVINRWFKIRGARAEIQRLNIEIKRFVTYLRDEDGILWRTAESLNETNLPMATEIRRFQEERARFNTQHSTTLRKLLKLRCWSGSLEPGTSLHQEKASEGLTHANTDRNYQPP
jgi:hypothetical protein